MRTVYAQKNKKIILGRQGEDNAVRVVWPGIVSDWSSLYGDGSFQLSVRRFGDENAYPVVVEVNGDDIRFTVTSAETAIAGNGKCELTYIANGTIAKSATWETVVLNSLTGHAPSEPPEEPAKSWFTAIQGQIGNLSNLATASKDNLVSAINEAAQSGGGGGASVELDTTLTQSGKAADAKAVGDALAEKQPKGDYLTQNELPDMTAYRTAEAQDVIDAGKQNTLIQSGAAVGQIAKITAVDDTGKPTAWEAVDMPSGGGETWELINEITIPDDAEETNALVINKDLNGNPFELKKALLFVYMPKYTGKSTIPNYAFSSLNGIHNGGSAPATYTNFVSPSSAQNRSMWWRVSVANNGLPYHEELAKTNVSGSKRVIGGSGATALFDGYIIDGTEPAKESITEIGTKGNLIYAGCYFALYGVRK